MYPNEEARKNPNRIAAVMGGSGRQLTYGQLDASANQLAHLFRDQGLVRHDHVAFFMENSLELIVACSAGERSGLYYSAIDAKFTAEEAAWIVNNSTARVVITTVALRPVAEELVKRCPQVERWLMVGLEQSEGPFESYTKVTETLPTSPQADERVGAYMAYTSGTTGRPKGIARELPDMAPSDPLPIMAFVAEIYRLHPGCVTLVPGPLHHMGGQAPASLTIRLGGTVVIMEHFDPQKYVELVDTYQVTNSLVVPTMMSRMLALPAEFKEKHTMASMETLLHGAAPCPTSVKQQMIDWVGPVVYEYYGATEGNGITFVDSGEALERPGTVGRAKVGEIVILDDDGNELPTGSIGQVWFRGRINYEYFDDEKKTAESRTPDAMLSTVGDIGFLDEDGYLFLTDRVAFTIVSGGVNIYPQEIENVLADHPDVADVAVIGVPNKDRGEEVKAIVQLRDGIDPDTYDSQILLDACEGRLAKFKRPRSIDYVDEVPRSSNGKLDKKGLRKKYWEGHATPLV
ncbi:AMP-binding protein [Rhodococcus sp. T7]|uniref:AMP-binding protein n=1 Tax=Rhodococcus sp. T7 TaxID=627444 RepID=UPI0013576EC8|nr:AMP-binding protein [Rhodococcus sp. T7]KAF0957118.1 Long-chain-fatty-acid--CoA ligase [Rhodococcus sp. T7]KAF0958843.1 Long-chain-fatty-acid--CoA ligase [Rhodococcus sp. T7]